MTNPNESAYPQTESSVKGRMFSGLTKREDFAIKLLQGLVTHSDVLDSSFIIGEADQRQLAESAVNLADVLIEELNKSKQV